MIFMPEDSERLRYFHYRQAADFRRADEFDMAVIEQVAVDDKKIRDRCMEEIWGIFQIFLKRPLLGKFVELIPIIF